MKILKCEFVKSAANRSGFLELDVPQIVVAGKSNVGKSTFINFLVNNKKMARTSNTPGRTRLVNYFKINDFYLIDLPGYGFAKGSKKEVAEWGRLMSDFFQYNEKISHVILLIDIRHAPSKEDREMVSFLYAYQIPFTVIATKADKLSRAQQNKNLCMLGQELKMAKDNIVPISALKKVGRESVFELFDKILGNCNS